MIASSQKPISYDYVIKLKLSRCPSENTNTTFSLNFQLQMFVMRFVSPNPLFPPLAKKFMTPSHPRSPRT